MQWREMKQDRDKFAEDLIYLEQQTLVVVSCKSPPSHHVG